MFPFSRELRPLGGGMGEGGAEANSTWEWELVERLVALVAFEALDAVSSW